VIRAAVVLATLVMLVVPAIARADALDDHVRHIALQLQCPVCEGETVADSPSGLAADMRALIRTKLTAGESDQQILDEFVASYGDSILTDPPKRGISLGVWVGPFVGVAFGLIVLGLLLRSWRRGSARVSTAPSVDTDVVDEFHRFRETFGQ
jgi:cytochrome c-type biogenesis protein CcmH